jgi:hypothetical protein
MGGQPNMTIKIPPQDPRATLRREVIAARRVGEGSRCACGEDRPLALIPGRDPMICAKCDREQKGKTPLDDHHLFGRANSRITISGPVGDHRAELSKSQIDSWPRKTLQNPDGSPLLSAAAHVRGFIDTVIYLMTEFLLWIADMLELLDTHLERKFGQKWWTNTKLESFEPES